MSTTSEVASSVVSEKTTFSWPVVVVLSGCLLAVGGGMVRVEAIQRDADLLRARVDLLEHQQGADRGQLHTQGATLNEVKTLLMELRVDVRDALRTVVRTADHRE